jgi:hypothetical protein
MDCPHCGLFNTPSALRCDCGFDLHAPQHVKAEARAAQAQRGWLELGAGVALLLFAAAGVGMLFVALQRGGRFFIAGSAALAGVGLAARGWRRLRNARGASE